MLHNYNIECDEFVKTHLIVKFKLDVLNEDYYHNHPDTHLKINDAFINSDVTHKTDIELFKSIVGLESTIKKLLSKFTPEMMTSITRNGDTLNFKNLLNISILQFDDYNTPHALSEPINTQFESNVEQEMYDLLDELFDEVIAPVSPSLQNEVVTNTSSRNYFNAKETIRSGKNVDPNIAIGKFIVANDGDAHFRAGIEISLEDGFEAIEGAEFTAKIEDTFVGCNTSLKEGRYTQNSENNYAVPGLSEKNLSFTLSPNPTSGSLNIGLADIEYNGSIIISDINGATIATIPSKSIVDNIISYDTSQLTSGTYFVTVQTNSGAITEQFVKLD